MSTGLNSLPARGPAWKWWVCGLLLLATMLNYMDRLTLNLMSARIMADFRLDARHYGQLESAFAFAFAVGAVVAGWLADRWSVRWLYPAAVLAWSAAGFATGLVHGFLELLTCRFLLGFAEAGNWPAALRTTQRILSPAERSLGNSILQSGAAVGAVLTPLIVMVLVTWRDPDAAAPTPGLWRAPFMMIGALGALWAFIWMMSVRENDLEMNQGVSGAALTSILGWLIVLLGLDVAVRYLASQPGLLPSAWEAAAGSRTVTLATKVTVCTCGIAGVVGWLLRATADETAANRPLFLRRLAALIVMVVAINITWHYFRAWLPLFLQHEHGYDEAERNWFFIAYYVATDIGSLAAGFTALGLTRLPGLSVHRGRMTVFLVFALLCSLSVVAARLPAGPLLLGMLLLIGFAALGLYPNYYSFSQELTVRHQGKLTGALGCINWLAMYLLHEVVGESVKASGSYAQGLALAGLPPLVGGVVMLVLWGRESGLVELPNELKRVSVPVEDTD